jgi:hypothetical protein
MGRLRMRPAHDVSLSGGFSDSNARIRMGRA